MSNLYDECMAEISYRAVIYSILCHLPDTHRRYWIDREHEHDEVRIRVLIEKHSRNVTLQRDNASEAT